jgi:hypothetical protein
MTNQELLAFCALAIKEFEKDMEVSKKNNMYEDYAYAEGARNAYGVMLNNLQKEN